MDEEIDGGRGGRINRKGEKKIATYNSVMDAGMGEKIDWRQTDEIYFFVSLLE